ncbi:hypothetical protein [Streptomyces sp. NPDC101393]|uniref:recombination directionality factor n=1 Tax=Streptomyces sp. NPDC101393 TaxID=3366141 RepID=UPI0037F2B937
MARTLRILDADPDARPKVRVSDFAGRFRAGMQLNDRPVSLKEWRVTTGDPAVADAIATAFGGSSESWETKKSDSLQVLTTTDSVKVVVDSADAVTFRMALFGANGKPTHVCDGVEFTDAEDPRFGQNCGCPSSLSERKAGAKAGYLPKPDQSVLFQLADLPELGQFRLNTASWDFMKALEGVWADLDKVGGPAEATLSLELVQFTTKAGVDVAYRKPVLTVHGPAAQAAPAAPKKSLSVVETEEAPAPGYSDEPPF